MHVSVCTGAYVCGAHVGATHIQQPCIQNAIWEAQVKHFQPSHVPSFEELGFKVAPSFIKYKHMFWTLTHDGGFASFKTSADSFIFLNDVVLWIELSAWDWRNVTPFWHKANAPFFVASSTIRCWQISWLCLQVTPTSNYATIPHITLLPYKFPCTNAYTCSAHVEATHIRQPRFQNGVWEAMVKHFQPSHVPNFEELGFKVAHRTPFWNQCFRMYVASFTEIVIAISLHSLRFP